MTNSVLISNTPKRKPIPVEILHELLDVDFDTGELRWKPRPVEMFKRAEYMGRWNDRYAGKVTGVKVTSEGYKSVRIHGKAHYAHRVVYAMYHGNWPEKHIDHINQRRDDNRITNLRDVTRSDNQRNMTMPKDNTSGFVGVYWSKQREKWVAKMRCLGADIALGSFVHKSDAIAARNQANLDYKFGPNHGAKGDS